MSEKGPFAHMKIGELSGGGSGGRGFEGPERRLPLKAGEVVVQYRESGKEAR